MVYDGFDGFYNVVAQSVTAGTNAEIFPGKGETKGGAVLNRLPPYTRVPRRISVGSPHV